MTLYQTILVAKRLNIAKPAQAAISMEFRQCLDLLSGRELQFVSTLLF
jgi:hypothetical protein